MYFIKENFSAHPHQWITKSLSRVLAYLYNIPVFKLKIIRVYSMTIALVYLYKIISKSHYSCKGYSGKNVFINSQVRNLMF